jgi:hypothetical protein
VAAGVNEALLTSTAPRIHNAFHFRVPRWCCSVLDTNLVQGIDFTTGGIAEYGDYMSGVVDLQSRRPLPMTNIETGLVSYS